jgi:hypothetical protein
LGGAPLEVFPATGLVGERVLLDPKRGEHEAE